MTPDRLGRFRIERPLGQGGMGEVFLALDEELHRKVAIKALPATLANNERLRERLHVEARTVAAVSHPSVGQIHDLISEGPNHYLVLEYVEGTTLASMVAADRPPFAESLNLAVDIAEGLAAAHAQGIVHRDLKADNIMVTPAGHAKILDFGLAKVLFESAQDDGAAAGGIAGTLSAMSPEQVERRPVDHRSDLFSFGTLLYQLTTGMHPFRQGMPVETMQRIVSHEPTPPHRLNRTVPRQLSGLIMQLLEKEVDKRPAETSEVAARLRMIRADFEAKSTDSERELKARRRRRALLIAGGVLISITAIAAWWFLKPPTPPPQLSVAVLRPTIPRDDPHGQAPMVAGAVRLSVINTLASLEGMLVINTGDVDTLQGPIPEIARAVAADEVISARVAAAEATYVIEISRLHGADGSVGWTDQVEVPVDDFHLVSEAIAGYVHKAYPERRRRRGAIDITAEPEQFESFLRTRDRVLNPTPDVSWPQLMNELKGIRTAAPRLLNAYVLEASIARYLYETTGDTQYSSRGEEVIQAVLEVAPDDYRSLLAEAESAIAWGQLDRAEQALDRAERQEPASVAAMRQRARLEEHRGNADRALDLLSAVAERWPSWRNLFNLARMERITGRIDSARAHLDEALRLAPSNVFLRARLANFEMMHGDLGRAEELYLSIAASSPQGQWLSELGTTQMMLGRYDDALQSFDRAFSLGTRSTTAMLNLGDCHALLGHDEEARMWYGRVVDSLSDDAPLTAQDLEIKAQALAQLGRSQESLNTIQKALELAPDAPNVVFAAALVHVRAGKYAQAKAYLDRSLELEINPRWIELPWFDALRDGADEHTGGDQPE